MRRFGEPRHIPSREVPVLELVGVHTAAIKPQLAHKLIKLLGEKSPLEGLLHLKRVAKRSQLKALQGAEEPSSLQIILCPVTPSTDASSPDALLPPAVLDIVTEHGLSPEVLQVSRFSPTTREELDEWGAFWPITWRPPDPHVPALPPPDSASASRSGMEQHMSTCLDMLCSCSAQDSPAAGTSGCHGAQCCRNAAVIVDASTGSVVGTGRDDTRHHPLLHAVMAAIESAAARDRRLWPSPTEPCAPETAAASSSPRPSSSTKRQRTSVGHCSHSGTHHKPPQVDAAAIAAASSASSSFAAVPGAAAAVPQAEAAQATPDGASAAELSAAKPYLCTPKPYLCTGFHCYVASEPCAMCAMALVHSRVARVIYCRQDGLQGALGGAFKLHQQRSLNHHYEAYHLPLLLPEDGKDLDGGSR